VVKSANKEIVLLLETYGVNNGVAACRISMYDGTMWCYGTLDHLIAKHWYLFNLVCLLTMNGMVEVKGVEKLLKWRDLWVHENAT